MAKKSTPNFDVDLYSVSRYNGKFRSARPMLHASHSRQPSPSHTCGTRTGRTSLSHSPYAASSRRGTQPRSSTSALPYQPSCCNSIPSDLVLVLQGGLQASDVKLAKLRGQIHHSRDNGRLEIAVRVFGRHVRGKRPREVLHDVGDVFTVSHSHLLISSTMRLAT